MNGVELQKLVRGKFSINEPADEVKPQVAAQSAEHPAMAPRARHTRPIKTQKNRHKETPG